MLCSVFNPSVWCLFFFKLIHCTDTNTISLCFCGLCFPISIIFGIYCHGEVLPFPLPSSPKWQVWRERTDSWSSPLLFDTQETLKLKCWEQQQKSREPLEVVVVDSFAVIFMAEIVIHQIKIDYYFLILFWVSTSKDSCLIQQWMK